MISLFSVLKVKYCSFSSIFDSVKSFIRGDMTFPNFSGDAVATATVGIEESLSKAICTEVTECGSKIIANSLCNDVIRFVIISSEKETEENEQENKERNWNEAKIERSKIGDDLGRHNRI